MQTALTPSVADAGRKLASVRESGSALSGKSQHPTAKEFHDRTRQAALGAFGRLIERHSSPKELIALLLSVMAPKDREEMAPIFEKIVIPDTARMKARMVGDALEIAADDLGKVVVRWPKFPQNTLNINGIDWTISTHQSIRFNLELLLSRMAPPDNSKKPTSALHQLILPEAHASWIGKIADWIAKHRLATVGTIFATVILTNLMNGLMFGGYSFMCSHAYQISDSWLSICATYLETVEKGRKSRDNIAKIAVDLPSKKGKVDGQSETEEKWSARNGKACPHDTDRVYIADVVLTKTVNGATKRTTPWYSVRAELDPDTNKKIQYAIISPRGTNMEVAGEREETAQAIFHIDPTTGKQMIDIRNQDPKKSSDPMVTIPVDTDESKLSPKENTENKKWQEFMRQLSFLVEACRAELNLQKLDDEEKKEKETGHTSTVPKDVPAEQVRPQTPPAEAPAKSVQ